jgi:hypothetical protein
VFSLYFLAKPLALLLAPGLARVFKTGHDYSMGRDFYDVLVNGNGLWFLWAYFVGELVTYGIVRLVRSRSYDAGIGLLLIACYLAVSHVLPSLQLPFRMMQGVEVAGFMLLGLAARNLLLTPWRGTSTALLLASAAVYVACAFAAVPTQTGIGSPSSWFAVLGMFAGVAVCVFLSALIGRSRVLEYVGRHSIVFYALNALMLNAAKLMVFRVLRVNGAALPAAGQWAVGVLVTVLAMLFMAVADLFVQRWMWWSIGTAKPVRRRGAERMCGDMSMSSYDAK